MWTMYKLNGVVGSLMGDAVLQNTAHYWENLVLSTLDFISHFRKAVTRVMASAALALVVAQYLSQ